MGSYKYRCPYCGGKLAVSMMSDSFIIGCSKCGIYVITNANELLNEIGGLDLSKPMDRILAKVLYKKYLMYSIKAIAIRENTKSINNSSEGR